MTTKLDELQAVWTKYDVTMSTKWALLKSESLDKFIDAQIVKFVEAAHATGIALDKIARDVRSDVSPWLGIIPTLITVNAANDYEEKVHLADQALQAVKVMASEETSAGYPGVVKLEQMRTTTTTFRRAIAAAQEYFNSIWHKIAAVVSGLINAAIQFVLDALKAAEDALKIAGGLLRALPWLILGGVALVGGLFVYRRVKYPYQPLLPSFARDRRGRQVVDVDSGDDDEGNE